MSDRADELIDALTSLDTNDKTAVRMFAQRVEALGDADAIEAVCSRSRSVRAAVGMLRAELLTQLLAHNDRDEFIRRTSDNSFMEPVDLESMKVPRYLSVEEHACACGAALMLPFERQGGPEYPFDCPTCRAAYLARPVYRSGEYRVAVEQDLRPAKKRKRRYAQG